MEKIVLARFQAIDGTGLWEVGPDGLWVNGRFYAFTPTAHIISRAEQGNSFKGAKVVEEDDDGFGLWMALAVYQETHSIDMAGLAAWALGGSTVSVVPERLEKPGTIQLSVGGLRRGDTGDISLRYREDGLNLQVTAVQHFATVALGAIKAYRAAHGPDRKTSPQIAEGQIVTEVAQGVEGQRCSQRRRQIPNERLPRQGSQL